MDLGVGSDNYLLRYMRVRVRIIFVTYLILSTQAAVLGVSMVLRSNVLGSRSEGKGVRQGRRKMTLSCETIF